MKKFLIFLIFIGAVHSAQAQMDAPSRVLVISPNQVFVDIMNEYLVAAYQDLDNDPMLTRKKRNVASVILHGLAQLCVGLGSIFGASNKHEKNQGMMHVAGTVLGVASQLASHSERPPAPVLQPEPIQAPKTEDTAAHDAVQKEQMTSKLADLTNSLIDDLGQEPCKGPTMRAPMLTVIRAISGAEQRKQLISRILACPGQTRQFLTELFSMIHNYANEKRSIFVTLLKERISEYLKKMPRISDIQDIGMLEGKSGMIIYAHTSQEISQDLLDNLANNFVATLQYQLKQIIGVDQSTTVEQAIAEMQEALIRLYCEQ